MPNAAQRLIGCADVQTHTRTIETHAGPRRLLIVAPERDAIIESDGLEALRTTYTGLDEALMAKIRSEKAPPHAVVLRARGTEGSGCFRLAHSLEDEQLTEAGYLVATAQLAAWRGLLRDRPLLVITRVELRVWELQAFRAGFARLREELDTAARGHDRERKTRAHDDLWLLEHCLLNFGVGLDTALIDLVPRALERAQSRRRPGLMDINAQDVGF